MKTRLIAAIIALFLGSTLPAILAAQTYELAPFTNQQYTDADGEPLAAGSICTYITGTLTPLVTYSNASGTANTACVTLDSAGRAQIYVTSAVYKFILKDSAGATVRTIDPVQAVGPSAFAQFNHTTNNIAKFGGSSTLTTSQITDDGSLVNIGVANPNLSTGLGLSKDGSTQLSMSRASADATGPIFVFYKSRGTHASPSNVTASDGLWSITGYSYSNGFLPGAVIRSDIDGAVTSGQAAPSNLKFATNISNGASTVRLTLTPAGAAVFSGRIENAQGTDTASANNLTLPANGNVFVISGATQINLLDNTDWQNGSIVTLLFSGAPTVKNNQATSSTFCKILLAGGVDFVATANDTLTLILINSIWYERSRAVI